VLPHLLQVGSLFVSNDPTLDSQGKGKTRACRHFNSTSPSTRWQCQSAQSESARLLRLKLRQLRYHKKSDLGKDHRDASVLRDSSHRIRWSSESLCSSHMPKLRVAHHQLVGSDSPTGSRPKRSCLLGRRDSSSKRSCLGDARAIASLRHPKC